MTQNITINYLVKQTASERNEKYDSNNAQDKITKTNIIYRERGESRKSNLKRHQQHNSNNNKTTWFQVGEKKKNNNNNYNKKQTPKEDSRSTLKLLVDAY